MYVLYCCVHSCSGGDNRLAFATPIHRRMRAQSAHVTRTRTDLTYFTRWERRSSRYAGQREVFVPFLLNISSIVCSYSAVSIRWKMSIDALKSVGLTQYKYTSAISVRSACTHIRSKKRGRTLTRISSSA